MKPGVCVNVTDSSVQSLVRPRDRLTPPSFHTTVSLKAMARPGVDAAVADALIQAARAVKLLGARAVLTGIRPEVADALVSLGVDLSGITTRGTLQDAIRDAQAQLQKPRR